MGITRKVMQLYETKDVVVYRVACDCIDPKCDAVVEIEWDSKLNVVSLSIYKKMTVRYIWGLDSWLEDLWNRLKIAVKILFTGYLETEGNMLFLERKHLEMFLHAIKEGILKMKKVERGK